MKIYNIKVVTNNNEITTGNLILIRLENRDYQLELEIGNIKLKDINTFPFIGLQNIRMELEKIGFKLLCKGSRINVYPSGALLGGRNAYLLTLGRSPERNETVMIFDEEIDIDKISSVEKQQKFYNDWKQSL